MYTVLFCLCISGNSLLFQSSNLTFRFFSSLQISLWLNFYIYKIFLWMWFLFSNWLHCSLVFLYNISLLQEVITSKMITLVDEVDHSYFLTESPSTLNTKFFSQMIFFSQQWNPLFLLVLCNILSLDTFLLIQGLCCLDCILLFIIVISITHVKFVISVLLLSKEKKTFHHFSCISIFLLNPLGQLRIL